MSSEALHHNPNDASLQYNYANSLGKAGRYEQAEKYFLKAIKLEPDTATYHANLGKFVFPWELKGPTCQFVMWQMLPFNLQVVYVIIYQYLFIISSQFTGKVISLSYISFYFFFPKM